MAYNNNGNGTIAYNNFIHMPQIPYRIFEKLATDTNSSAENLWKILKYPTSDALSNPNLTYAEKMAMLWTPDKVNSSEENLFNVFLKRMIPSALDDAQEQIQLRIYRIKGKPSNNIESMLAYEFDMYTHEKCSMVYDADGFLVERTDLMEAYILDCLNGADIGIGSSFLSYDSRMMNNYVSSTLGTGNGKSLYPRSVVMALLYVDKGLGGVCGG